MRFTGFPEIQLNPGLRDIGDCLRAKPTHRAGITRDEQSGPGPGTKFFLPGPGPGPNFFFH